MRHPLLACFFLISTVALAPASAEPFRFPEGKHGQGELKYVHGLPVLIVAGRPEEMGEQMGLLAMKPAASAVEVFRALLKREKLELIQPLLVRFGENLLAKYPDNYRREFEAMVKASGLDRNMLIMGNTFNELRHLAGCSGLMIDPGRSATGGALMGRNWDFPPIEGLHAFSLLIVYRPQGKKPFAVVSFPGAVAAGCLQCAMNVDGLAIGGNYIGLSKDGAPQVEWKNLPSAVVARRIMEECSTIAEAERLIRDNRPAERHALVACDRSGGAVFEITSKTLATRRSHDAFCFATNDFLSPELGTPTKCWRAAILQKGFDAEKLSIADVAKEMHAVNQAAWTAHTIVFEPNTLQLHVAFGDGKKSATEFPLKDIDLAKILRP